MGVGQRRVEVGEQVAVGRTAERGAGTRHDGGDRHLPAAVGHRQDDHPPGDEAAAAGSGAHPPASQRRAQREGKAEHHADAPEAEQRAGPVGGATEAPRDVGGEQQRGPLRQHSTPEQPHDEQREPAGPGRDRLGERPPDVLARDADRPGLGAVVDRRLRRHARTRTTATASPTRRPWWSSGTTATSW